MATTSLVARMTTDDRKTYVNAVGRTSAWSHYCKYGIGEFDNSFSMKRENFPRERVVEVLKHPEGQQWAQQRLEMLEKQTVELRELLYEAGDLSGICKRLAERIKNEPLSNDDWID